MLQKKSTKAIYLQGHINPEQKLRKLCDDDKIGQAWIFSGPKGIGKVALAYRLVCFLYSDEQDKVHTQNKTLKINENATVYNKLDAGAIRDFLIVDNETDSDNNKQQIIIPASKIRKINQFFANHSSIGYHKKRVCIVDEADKMTKEAANSMLKILEEPPQDVIFILIAHNYHYLPITIRSRCYNLSLRPLSEQTMKDFLSDWQNKQLDKQLDENISRKIIKYAKGVPAKAIFIANNQKLCQQIDEALQDMPKINIDKIKNLADKTETTNEKNIECFQYINDCIADFIYDMVSEQIDGNKNIKISQNTGLGFHFYLEKAIKLHLEILNETNLAIRLYQNKPLLIYDFFNRLRQFMIENDFS